ncbi:MAG: hypothetical protein ACTSR8_18760 [Promethearchaeota archaeon]
MAHKNLTDASIRKNKKKPFITLDVSLTGIKNFDYPYFLIIQSSASNCTRLTIYPIKNEKILKLNISGADVSDSSIEQLSNILKKYDVIHTSGLLIKQKQLNYECYLNLSFSDIKYKDLKTSLNKIRNIFKHVIIEEIGLKKNKAEKL